MTSEDRAEFLSVLLVRSEAAQFFTGTTAAVI